MKLLLMAVLVIMAYTGSAQQITGTIIYRLTDRIPQSKHMDSLIAIYENKHPEKFIHPVKPKPGTHFLADGMPCIVPESPTTGLIPNAWNGNILLPFRSKPPVMPNPALPYSKQSDPNTGKKP
jgi:hypothetical protein